MEFEDCRYGFHQP